MREVISVAPPGGDKPLDWVIIIAILALGLFMVGCCGWPLIKRLRKNKGKTNDRNDKHKGCH